MNILYVHSSGPFGGSSRSLYEMISAIPLIDKKTCNCFFLTQKGTSCNYFSRLGVVVDVPGLPQFDHGVFSYYRGWRWLVLIREFLYVYCLLIGLVRIARKEKNIDIVHINDYVNIFSGVLLSVFFKAKLVVHVRCLVNDNRRLFRTRVLHFLIKKFSHRVICIDDCVRRTLPKDLPCEVIHNGLNLKQEDLENIRYRRKGEMLKVGFVGNMLYQKGILDLIDAARICREQSMDVEFHIFGDAAKTIEGIQGRLLSLLGLKQDVKQKIYDYMLSNNLFDVVYMHGFAEDLKQVYKSIDVICFPSHLNATGRPVIEAAYFSRPSIVAVDNPTNDTLIHRKTGLAVPAFSPSSLAEGIGYFADNNGELLSMGKMAKRLAADHYDQRKNSLSVISLYNNLMD